MLLYGTLRVASGECHQVTPLRRLIATRLRQLVFAGPTFVTLTIFSCQARGGFQQLGHTDPCARAGDGLLALKTGWTNWEVFAEENQVLGWNQSLDVCQWTGVYCLNNSGIGRVFWLCEPTPPLPPCCARPW